MPDKTYRVVILGSGFAGSLLAWILSRSGLSVALVDKAKHPRFAIGESSTPLADFLLEQISDRFQLPELKPLARWGSWCRELPQLRRGKKRGFSYYSHRSGQAFSESVDHDRSLLVSASASDEVSDTHWMRCDVDEWLCRQSQACGTDVYEGYSIVDPPARCGDGWKLSIASADDSVVLHADWIVDASGGGGVMPRACGVADASESLRTRTGTLFAHVTGLGSMTEHLSNIGCPLADDPFNGDDAAQHHVLDDGWVWMLRFSCGITSVGLVKPCDRWPSVNPTEKQKREWWHAAWQRYPSLAELMKDTEVIGPMNREGHAALGWMPRISRLWSRGAGARWLALPSTVGVIDPLHSTGIAHGLWGVKRAAEILLASSTAKQNELTEAYGRDVVREVRWIDSIVSLCFAALEDFELFTAVCSFYFLGAHGCETEMSETGRCASGFLGVDRAEWAALIEQARVRLSTITANREGRPSADVSESAAERRDFVDWLRGEIASWNRIGLLGPSCKNRLARAAAPKERNVPLGT